MPVLLSKAARVFAMWCCTGVKQCYLLALHVCRLLYSKNVSARCVQVKMKLTTRKSSNCCYLWSTQRAFLCSVVLDCGPAQGGQHLAEWLHLEGNSVAAFSETSVQRVKIIMPEMERVVGVAVCFWFYFSQEAGEVSVSQKHSFAGLNTWETAFLCLGWLILECKFSPARMSPPVCILSSS